MRNQKHLSGAWLDLGSSPPCNMEIIQSVLTGTGYLGQRWHTISGKIKSSHHWHQTFHEPRGIQPYLYKIPQEISGQTPSYLDYHYHILKWARSCEASFHQIGCIFPLALHACRAYKRALKSCGLTSPRCHERNIKTRQDRRSVRWLFPVDCRDYSNVSVRRYIGHCGLYIPSIPAISTWTSILPEELLSVWRILDYIFLARYINSLQLYWRHVAELSI